MIKPYSLQQTTSFPHIYFANSLALISMFTVHTDIHIFTKWRQSHYRCSETCQQRNPCAKKNCFWLKTFRVSTILNTNNTNYPRPCIQRNLPATVRNFDPLRFRYSRFHCTTKWEAGSTAPGRKTIRCLEFQNDILLERPCGAAEAVRRIKRPAELRVACFKGKTIYGYRANHKTLTLLVPRWILEFCNTLGKETLWRYFFKYKFNIFI
jgi:hypothetical protein